MPDIVDALRVAQRAYETAVALSPSTTNWKALIQTLDALRTVDPNGVDFDLAAAARDALAHMDPVGDAEQISYVEFVLRSAVDRESPAVAQRPGSRPRPVPEEPLATLSGRVGIHRAATVGVRRVQEGVDGLRDDADAILEELWSLIDGEPDEALRHRVLSGFVARFVSAIPPGARDESRSLTARLPEFLRVTAEWPPTERAAALLGLALRSNRTDEEALAMPLVDAALEADPGMGRGRRGAAAFVRAQLTYGEACNVGSAGRDADAIEGYADAAIAYLDCGLGETALHNVQRVAQHAALNQETAVRTVIALGRHAPRLERDLGAEATSLLAYALRTSSAHLLQGCSREAPWLRDQVGKGLRFATAVAAPRPVRLDATLHAGLTAVEVARQAAVEDRSDPARPLDDEHFLASFVAPAEAAPGQSPAEVLLNVQRAFDERLATVAYSDLGTPPWRAVDHVQSLLDERTVLLSLFLGASPDGELAVHAQAVARGIYAGSNIPLGFLSSLLELRAAGTTLNQSPIGVLVSNLRRAVVDEPMFDDVSPEAAADLGRNLTRWLGHLAAQLPGWNRDGFTHLAIWPQGPLHYLPWPLYTVPATGRLLAEDWVVTTLPTLGLLGRRPRRGASGILAVGCSESGVRYGLAPVPSMPAQAEAVARTFGQAALREVEATVEGVVARMPGARFIHVATHGSHVAEAPAFQCVYLTPTATDDGRLYAYHLAQLDLSGVELVTLSACETSLGRFDLGDNLRGLPAALLAAGAAAVIGALWPVAPDVATTFFRTLYERLAAHAPRLDAFHAAQGLPEHGDGPEGSRLDG